MKKADVIILAGQSNAVGVGFCKYLPKHFSDEKAEEYRKGYEDIKINYFSHDKKSDGFVPVTFGCTELTKDTFGPELGMAEYMTEMGGGTVYQAKPFTPSDDMAFLTERVPSAYLQLGAKVPGNPYPHHNACVLFDEKAMPYGAALHAQCAFEWLKNHHCGPEHDQ